MMPTVLGLGCDRWRRSDDDADVRLDDDSPTTMGDGWWWWLELGWHWRPLKTEVRTG